MRQLKNEEVEEPKISLEVNNKLQVNRIRQYFRVKQRTGKIKSVVVDQLQRRPSILPFLRINKIMIPILTRHAVLIPHGVDPRNSKKSYTCKCNS